MANNLTPQQLAEIRRLFDTPVESSDVNANAYRPESVYYDGNSYTPQPGGGFAGYEYNPTNWADPRTQHASQLNGQDRFYYGADGTNTGQDKMTGITDKNSIGEFLTGLAMMAPAFAAGMSPGINSAMSFGTNPVTGGMGGGALDFGGSAMGAGAGGGAAAGGGASIGGGAGNGAFLGEGVASGVPAWDAAAKTAGLSLGGGGLLDGISGKALGIGASLLGGALGSKGTKSEQSQTRDIPEWLKPYVTGTLNGAQGLFNTQMSPEYQQRWTNLGNQAQGMLAPPVAGNGFNKFFGGK